MIITAMIRNKRPLHVDERNAANLIKTQRFVIVL